MTTHADAIFETREWEEGSFAPVAGGIRLTRALVTGSYSGDIEGKTTLAFIMHYPDEQRATYNGLERIEGRIAGRMSPVPAPAI